MAISRTTGLSPIEGAEVYSLRDALQILFEGTVPYSKIGSLVKRCLLKISAAWLRLDFMLTELGYCDYHSLVYKVC